MQVIGPEAEADGEEQPDVAFHPRPHASCHADEEWHDAPADHHSRSDPSLAQAFLHLLLSTTAPPGTVAPAPLPPPARMHDEADDASDHEEPAKELPPEGKSCNSCYHEDNRRAEELAFLEPGFHTWFQVGITSYGKIDAEYHWYDDYPPPRSEQC